MCIITTSPEGIHYNSLGLLDSNKQRRAAIYRELLKQGIKPRYIKVTGVYINCNPCFNHVEEYVFETEDGKGSLIVTIFGVYDIDVLDQYKSGRWIVNKQHLDGADFEIRYRKRRPVSPSITPLGGEYEDAGSELADRIYGHAF